MTMNRNWNWPHKQRDVLTDKATSAESRLFAIKKVRTFHGRQTPIFRTNAVYTPKKRFYTLRKYHAQCNINTVDIA